MNKEIKKEQPLSQAKSMRFSRTFFVTMILFLGCSIFIYFSIGRYLPENEARYQKLVYGNATRVTDATNSVQNRLKVQKQIFFSDKSNSYELLLTAKNAELFLSKCNGFMEIKELMHDVKCTLRNLRDGQVICSMNAEHADYSTKQVQLKGKVHIYSNIMTLSAELLTLRSTDDKLVNRSHGISSANFDRVEMVEKVEVLLNQGGKLLCDKAFINLTTLDNLTANDDKQTSEDVAFKTLSVQSDKKARNLEALNSNYGKSQNFELKSEVMNIEVVKDASNYQILEVRADKNVTLKYDKELTATGQNAVYRRKDVEIEFKKNGKDDLLNGNVTLFPAADSLCKVTSSNAEIYSTKIDVDTMSKECVFTAANGFFFNSNKIGEKIAFSADKLFWNTLTETLVLSGHSLISQEGIGIIKASEDIHINFKKIDGKTALSTIETHGALNLDYIDPDSNLNHTLKSYGSLKIDHQKMYFKFLSPKDSVGKVIPGKEIYFEDIKGDIIADRAFFKYELLGKTFSPVRIVLEGDVKIQNRLAVSDIDKTPVKQYILADRVDFLPRTKEMIFKSTGPNRVLLFDEANELQVSARALKINREIATKKESLEGLGDVRLSFAETEFQRLRDHFNQDKDKKGKADKVPNRF